MAQEDYTIDNAPGATVRADINNHLEAIVTNNSGQTAPSETFPWMIWVDTDQNLVRQRNGSNTAWVTIGSLSGSTWIPYRDGNPQGTASTRDVGTGSGANLLDRDQLDGRLMRRSQNGADIDNPAEFRDNAGITDAIENRASSIGQSDLNTTTGNVSASPDGAESGTLTLPGGRFSFLAQTESSGSGATDFGTRSADNPSSWALNFTYAAGAAGGSVGFRNRYIQSSPPYNHGDGLIAGYAYASINPSGDVMSLYLAEDPPWYGNTQNAPVKQWRDPKTGKEYQRVRKLKCSKRDVDEGRMSFAEFMERAGECEDVVEEITPEVKLRGMEGLPHPFDEKPDRTIVLLDPMDEKIGRLIRMMQTGEDVHELFREGYLIVDNEPCKRCGPPGVPVHMVRWRKT